MSLSSTSIHSYPPEQQASLPRPPFGGLDPVSKEAELFTALKPIRRAMAMKLGIPPYFIVSDANLADLVTVRPANAEVLLCVKGFGAAKLERYGEEILQAVREHAELLNLPLLEEPPARAQSARAARTRTERAPVPDTVRAKAFAAFARGDALGDICVALNRAPVGVVDLLVQFAVENGLASLEPWLSDADLAQIEARSRELGVVELPLLFVALGGRVAYPLLRLALGFLAARPGSSAATVA